MRGVSAFDWQTLTYSEPGPKHCRFLQKMWSRRLGRYTLATSHDLRWGMTCMLTARLIRATGNAVFAPALQRCCGIFRHVGLCKPCDVTFASLAARKLGHHVAGSKAILWQRKTFHGETSHSYVSIKAYSSRIHDKRIQIICTLSDCILLRRWHHSCVS